MRSACYHARANRARYGQRVTVLVLAKRGVHPRNALVAFRDGTHAVTNIGCLRFKCDKHPS